MDISEVWRNSGFLIAPLLALFLLRRSRRISTLLMRRVATASASLFLALSALALMLDGCELESCTARRPGIVSPDGKHVAIVTWFLDGARVDLRSRYLPWGTRVYRGRGEIPINAADPGDPVVTWTDAHHLWISSGSRALECRSTMDDIAIQCD